MGNMWERDIYIPDPNEGIPKFDPMLGFPNSRKERVVQTTVEEMESAGVEPYYRDYCIDDYMKFLSCRRVHFPLVYKCKHEVHAHKDCQYRDHVLRMKEYEREKRLSKLVKQREQDVNG